MKTLRRSALLLCVLTLALSLAGCMRPSEGPTSAKPVLYLYPEREAQVSVTLDFSGRLIATYPAYDGGWHVTAMPDGTLYNHADGKEYSYLFWEGVADVDYDLSKGFVVRGEDTAEFLQRTLAEIGLTPREYNEFIVYWLPRMQDSPYNLISFQTTRYTDSARLTITPQPDSLLRVFMVFRPLDEPVDVAPQSFFAFTRTGFTAVEWGGAQLS